MIDIYIYIYIYVDWPSRGAQADAEGPEVLRSLRSPRSSASPFASSRLPTSSNR